MYLSVMITRLQTKRQIYMKLSHCTDCTTLTVQWHNHANSEGTIQTFIQEYKVKQQNFSQKVHLEVLWLQVGFAILYLDHVCINYSKIYKTTQNSIANNVT